MAQTYLDPQFRPTHHLRDFTLVVLAAIVSFIVAIVLMAHYQPLR